MSVFCIAAGVLGAVLGYILNWALRHNPKPDATEIIALIGMIAGGIVVQLIKDNLLQCPGAVAWYLIGVGVGFFIYSLALWVGWEKIKTEVSEGKLDGLPFSPFKFW